MRCEQEDAYINHKLKQQPKKKRWKDVSTPYSICTYGAINSVKDKATTNRRWEMQDWLEENSSPSLADYATPIQ